jgi:hypothetical protein
LYARFKALQNIYVWITLISLAGAIASGALSEWFGVTGFGIVGAVGAFFSAKYALIARRYRELGKTNE